MNTFPNDARWKQLQAMIASDCARSRPAASSTGTPPNGLRAMKSEGEIQMARTTSTRFHRAWGVAVLPAAVALALTACGGGGGNVRTTPPPATPPPPTGIGFTPTVANDASLVVNPPSVPTLAAPRALGSQQLSSHLILTNAAGALGAGLTGQGVTIGVLDSGVDRTHPGLAPRVTRNIMPPSSWTGYDRTVDDKVRHGTVVAMLAAVAIAVAVDIGDLFNGNDMCHPTGEHDHRGDHTQHHTNGQVAGG